MTNDEKETSVEAVMYVAQRMLRDLFGKGVVVVMMAKEEDSVETHVASNVEHEDTFRMMKGFVDHYKGASRELD